MPRPSHTVEPSFDFQGDRFDLSRPRDAAIVRFLLSQALFGEATGVYCGKSLYAARNLEAARFYLRQAQQELSHLEIFGRIFRILNLTPEGPHWVIRLLSSHNNDYRLKVLMEHAIGEGMVLDVFKEVMLQTLPSDDVQGRQVQKMLRGVCAQEIEHVEWGEKEVRRLISEQPSLRWAYYGLIEIQLLLAPLVARRFVGQSADHNVLRHLPRFVDFVIARVRAQSRALGITTDVVPSAPVRLAAMLYGAALFVRSQFARSRSTLDHTYITELGFVAR